MNDFELKWLVIVWEGGNGVIERWSVLVLVLSLNFSFVSYDFGKYFKFFEL